MSVLIQYSDELLKDTNSAVKVLCNVCSSLLRLKSFPDKCEQIVTDPQLLGRAWVGVGADQRAAAPRYQLCLCTAAAPWLILGSLSGQRQVSSPVILTNDVCPRLWQELRARSGALSKVPFIPHCGVISSRPCLHGFLAFSP